MHNIASPTSLHIGPEHQECKCHEERRTNHSSFTVEPFCRGCQIDNTRKEGYIGENQDDDIAKILEAGRYCPTGTNAQDFSFIVLREKKDEAEKEAVKLFRTAQKAATPFSSYIKYFDIDDRFFFKNAPIVILVTSKSSTSGCLASSYMELMAYSLGLGVLYSGFFVAAVKFSKKLSSMLSLEKGSKLVTCLVIGHPDVDYERIPPRKEAKIKWL